MFKRVAVLALVATLSMAMATAAWAGPIVDRIKKNKVLVVGTNADFPPFTMKGKDGKPMGLDMDLARRLAAGLKVKLDVKVMPFPELLQAIAAGKVDVGLAGITVMPERNLNMVFAGPYFVTGQSIVLKADVAAALAVPQDLNKPDFSLAVAKGTTGEMAAKEAFGKATIVVKPTMPEAFQALQKGEVKGLVADLPFCALQVFRHKADKLAVLDQPFTFEPLAVAIPPGDPEMVNLVQNFLGAMEGTGTLKKMQEYWFKNPAWMKDMAE